MFAFSVVSNIIVDDKNKADANDHIRRPRDPDAPVLSLLKSEEHIKLKYNEIKNSDYIKPVNIQEDHSDHLINQTSPLDRRKSMSERRKFTTQYCHKQKRLNRGKMAGNMYLYEPKHIAYCAVPKAGCTFWKRIMRFLNKDFDPKSVSNPFDISRRYTHYAPFKTTPTFALSSNKFPISLKNRRNTIMFSRDPYSRVWSAYLDKLFLPDFWRTQGINIVKAERNHASGISLTCGHDVIFGEFIRYIVHNLKHASVESHFAPIHTICDPCRINFTYIGNLETFANDVTYILKEIEITSLIESELFNNTAEHEIKSLSEDYLDMTNRHWNSTCKNKTLICERLWKVFQMNGYIGFEVQLPSGLNNAKNGDQLKEQFISQAIAAHKSSKQTHKHLKAQKRLSLANAYKALPHNLLLEFQAAYDIDFELFGYEKQPHDIYDMHT